MIEILTSDEMGEADRLTIAGGVPGLTLMENAGSAVAQAVAARQSAGSRVVVLAGPGNNGGDGFVAARVLAQHHYRMKILLVGDREKLTGDAAAAANRWNRRRGHHRRRAFRRWPRPAGQWSGTRDDRGGEQSRRASDRR